MPDAVFTESARAGRALYRHDELVRLLHPRSIAVVGASSRPGSFGERVVNHLAGFDGTVYPVNARYERIGERICFPSIEALPEAPDCVVVAVSREAVEPIIVASIAAGVGGVIVLASGYAETGKLDRVALQQRLADMVRGTPTRLIGPNCIGIVNYLCGARITFAGHAPGRVPPPGAIGVVSQSGALGFALSQAIERGVPISHVLTSGNSCDVDVADYVAYLAQDRNCRTIACLFEGMAAPQRILQAAEIAWAADKPLVVHKIATGSQGAAAALSHTGSLAGSDAAYRAAFARAGVIVVDTMEALIETASFFAKAAKPCARGVAVAATSGGAAIMAADKAERHGVPLPQPGADTRAVLESRIPEFGSPRNPCDVTAQVLNDPESLRACALALLGDNQYGTLVVPHVLAYDVATERMKAISALAAPFGKPVCNVWLTEWWEGPGAQETEQDPHTAMFRSMDRCFATLAAWHAREERRRAGPRHLVCPVSDNQRTRVAELLSAAPDPVLTERATKQTLSCYGIAIVAERLVHTVEDAVDAAASIGYPVALKLESRDVLHKTEAGVVRLGLRSADEVRAAFAEIGARADALSLPPRIDGVLVQEMSRPGVEVMVGARTDPLFGPLILVGLGGVLVELMQDTATALAPVTQAEARDLLAQLKGTRLLDGFRGAPSVDRDALADAICRISWFAADHAAAVAEIDVNPLICTGSHIVAVDGLIVRRIP